MSLTGLEQKFGDLERSLGERMDRVEEMLDRSQRDVARSSAIRDSEAADSDLESTP